jgi:hypothetical protein
VAWRQEVVPFATKRSEFSDEREHRIILIDTDLLYGLGNSQAKERFTLNLPFKDLVRDVLLSPSTTSGEAARIEASLHESGFRGRVARSNLYSVPNHDFVMEKPITES